MAPPKNSSKDDDLPSDGRDDETNPMATGTYKVEVTTMPDANTFRPLIPETAGGGNASVSTIPIPFGTHRLFWLKTFQNIPPQIL